MSNAWDSSYKVRAVLDEQNQYRYLFECTWGLKERYVTFIMLNPSVGNQDRPDPTLKRCINFAKDWGYDGVRVVNLFAGISTKPQNLSSMPDPIGPENDYYISTYTKDSEMVVLAWGQSITSNFARSRMEETLFLLRDKPLYCLAKTNCGTYPKHPLFLRRDLTPIPFVNH